jgi:hypothetical protein
MPRRCNPLRFPSYRNLQLYHQWVDERRSQAAIAAEQHLSQRRVSQIAQQVRGWVDRLVPPKHYLGDEAKRFHLAIAQERIRLHQAYDPLLAMFLGEEGQPRYLRRSLAVVGGQPLHTVEISELPNVRLLDQAASVQGRLAQLEAVANLGPFADLPLEVHQTIIHRAAPAHEGVSAQKPASDAAGAASASSNGSASHSNSVSNGSMNASNALSKTARGVLA